MQKEILILVDDNPTTLFYNTDLLGDIYVGKEIISYENSDVFLRDYLSEKFSEYSEILLFLDINMPEYSGYEVLEEIEEEIEEIDNLKVIMLTSSRLKSDIEKSSRFSQIQGYIEKPLTKVKLNDCFQINKSFHRFIF